MGLAGVVARIATGEIEDNATAGAEAQVASWLDGGRRNGELCCEL
jgi:hypothetical protein